MNVYQLKVKGECCGGMALVAAPTFEWAKVEYRQNGVYGDYFEYGEFSFDEKYSHPIDNLEWHGKQRVICESIYIE